MPKINTNYFYTINILIIITKKREINIIYRSINNNLCVYLISVCWYILVLWMYLETQLI